MSWTGIAIAALTLAAVLLLVAVRRIGRSLNEIHRALKGCGRSLADLLEVADDRREAEVGIPLPRLHISGSNAKMAKLRDDGGKLVGSLSETYIYALLHMPPADMRKYNVEVRLIERKGGEE